MPGEGLAILSGLKARVTKSLTKVNRSRVVTSDRDFFPRLCKKKHIFTQTFSKNQHVCKQIKCHSAEYLLPGTEREHYSIKNLSANTEQISSAY